MVRSQPGERAAWPASAAAEVFAGPFVSLPATRTQDRVLRMKTLFQWQWRSAPSAPRAAAQCFRPLLRGRGHRSAMSLPPVPGKSDDRYCLGCATVTGVLAGLSWVVGNVVGGVGAVGGRCGWKTGTRIIANFG